MCFFSYVADMHVREEILYFIWKFRQFRQAGLSTVDGEPLEIIRPGRQNEHSGPDFEHARIRIGGLTWRFGGSLKSCWGLIA